MIDEIIKSQDEFAVYTNLSRRLEKKKNILSEHAQNGSDDFQRRGFAWVIALARVEVGAMLAGFTNVRSPFAAMQPTKYEMKAYRELLLDGTRTHYWALANDPKFTGIIATSATNPSSDTVAYVRRLTVARAFLDATGQLAEGRQLRSSADRRTARLSSRDPRHDTSRSENLQTTRIKIRTRPIQQVQESPETRTIVRTRTSQGSEQPMAELKLWRTNLDRLQHGLRQSIARYLARSPTYTQSSTTTLGESTQQRQAEQVAACGRMLAGERYELARGTARVEFTPVEGTQ